MSPTASTAPEIGRFDYVIVGAGAAGCVLANRLSADPEVRVLLLEAGGSKPPLWVHVPLGIYRTIGDPRTDWCFKTEPEPQLDGRRIPIPRGFGLGGSTLINGMVYIRGQREDYDRWEALGNPGWGWRDVLPVFRQHEDFHAGANEHHGAGGEWRVEDIGTRWPVLDRFAQAAASRGVPTVSDINETPDGLAYFHVNIRGGVRVSGRSAFLDPVRSRPNLTVLSDASATRLLFDGKRAVGVEFRHGQQLRRAGASAEVLLAAGAIGSPQLLQASGVGAPELLQPLGIPVVHALPGVGENLQDHLQTRCVVRVADGQRTMNQRAHGAFGRFLIGLDYALRRRGPLAASATKMCGFLRSTPQAATPDVQYHVIPMSTVRFGGPVHPWPGVTVSICHLRPTSRGHVRLRSADVREAPAITGNFLATEEDRRVMVEAMKRTREVFATSPMREVVREELEPGPGAATDDALLAHVRATAMTVFHPVGTCRMGRDAEAVVDARLRVQGLSGLRVVDASIMPTIVSGNTAAAAVMIGEKAAAMIRADRRQSAAVAA